MQDAMHYLLMLRVKVEPWMLRSMPIEDLTSEMSGSDLKCLYDEEAQGIAQEFQGRKISLKS